MSFWNAVSPGRQALGWRVLQLEHVGKQQVIRDIYHRASVAAGLLGE